MRLISYAQNAEDVLLWRALGHIRNGFYIDVGANDPVDHSVTKLFYDAGWRGINIEPLPSFHDAFMAQRPRDINLAIAAGDTEGSLTLYDVPAVNGWASPDPAVAAAHKADGHVVRDLIVPVRTLAAVCREHAKAEIHFLKIDVEGFETEVLRGMDFDAFRPWLLVIEATLPNSRETNHAAWEALVTTKGYTFAWFDGLNRYYVSAQHPELMAALTVQPNVFDDYISHHLDKAWTASEAASADAAAAHARVADLGQREWQAIERADHAEQRAERARALSEQALSNAANLLLQYTDAEKRVALANASLAAARAEGVQLKGHVAQLNAEALQLHAQAVQLHAAIDERNGAIAAKQLEIEQAWRQSEAVQAWGHDLEQRVLAMQASRSWRLTRPVRAAGGLLRRLGLGHLRARAASLPRRVLVAATRNELARRLLIPLMRRLPDRGMGLSVAINAIKQPPAPDAPAAPLAPAPSAPTAPPDEILHLSASARKVFADLQHARAAQTTS